MAARPSARQVVPLGRACDNACVFCAQEGLPREAVPDVVLPPQPGVGGITFVGGEPGIDSYPKYIDTLVARVAGAFR